MGEDVIFSMDNILDDSQADKLGLFQDDDQEETAEVTQTEEEAEEESSEEEEKEEKNNKTTEVDPNKLFEDDEPESVGSGKTKKEIQENASSEDSDDSSPTKSVYSSIAKACYNDDVFPDLEQSDIDAVKDADSFRELIEKQIAMKLTPIQQRVNNALTNGVAPTEVQYYEQVLENLNSITDDIISEESDRGEEIRKRIIYQDYINKGFNKERAAREVKKAIDNCTDVEDAKDALESSKEFFNAKYTKICEDAEKEAEKLRKKENEEAEALKTSIEKDNYLGDITLDKTTRRKIFDNISKPKFRDDETGTTYTALQQYEKEHKADFLKYVGTIFTVTDGFKNFDIFVKGKVKKEINKNMRELESKLANNYSSNSSDGTLTFMGGDQSDLTASSPFAKGWKLNI